MPADRNHACVVGGSIAGLLAARVLSEHFAQVTILERDELPLEPKPRKGTPHAQHTHGLLARGLTIFEELFPGIREELISLGASFGDLVGDCHWHAMGGFHAAAASGIVAVSQSRALLEWVVRRRVQQLPNVIIRDKTPVEMPVTDVAFTRICGLRIIDHRTQETIKVCCDLVIDASGRGSRLPRWLAELGYEPPQDEQVIVSLAYATRLFHRREEAIGGRLGMVVTQSPPNKRFAAMIKMEGQLWTISMGGMLGDWPQPTESGFREFAAGLPTPEIFEYLKTAEPASEIMSYKYPGSIWRRYDRLRRMPLGILPLGDSIATFNPIYGQGMTVAALEARLLGECLAYGAPNLTQQYLRRMAELIQTPWQIAAGSDLRNPYVRGQRTIALRIGNAYLNRIHRAAHRDPVVAVAFHRVANLLDLPTSLCRPEVLCRMLWPRR
jgi:2-polyprenyl-6-methoxyphenol hydroxylase-like FAD-dependent oxidoreductase